jgi:hypothetical protein
MPNHNRRHQINNDKYQHTTINFERNDSPNIIKTHQYYYTKHNVNDHSHNHNNNHRSSSHLVYRKNNNNKDNNVSSVSYYNPSFENDSSNDLDNNTEYFDYAIIRDAKLREAIRNLVNQSNYEIENDQITDKNTVTRVKYKDYSLFLSKNGINPFENKIKPSIKSLSNKDIQTDDNEICLSE